MRYAEANRKAKSQILNEFCKTTDQHRKHVIRLLTTLSIAPRKNSPGRKKKYQPEYLLPLLMDGNRSNVWQTIESSHTAFYLGQLVVEFNKLHELIIDYENLPTIVETELARIW